jgi:hypothetical protein
MKLTSPFILYLVSFVLCLLSFVFLHPPPPFKGGIFWFCPELCALGPMLHAPCFVSRSLGEGWCSELFPAELADFRRNNYVANIPLPPSKGEFFGFALCSVPCAITQSLSHPRTATPCLLHLNAMADKPPVPWQRPLQI